MRLLIISTMNGFSWGGSEELWWQTASYARSQSYEVRVVVFENKPVHKKLIALQEQGIHIDFIGKQESIIPPLWKRVLSKLLNKEVSVTYKDRFSFIHEFHADLVLLSQGGTADITYYADLTRFFGNLQTPYVVLNQHHQEYGSFSDEQKNVLLDLFKRAEKLFFVAHRNKDVLERQLVVDLSRAEIVKNPVTISERNTVIWPNSTIPQFAVVARLDTDFKGQDILLQTLATDKWQKRNFIVNMFGHGPHEGYLKKLIQFYGLQQKVFLKGQSEDIEKIWEHHHLLILPSHSEGTPLSLVEAMLCGRPCLVTDVGDSASLIKDNHTGWIACTASVKALDEALVRTWQQQFDWKKMGLLAHEDAKVFACIDPGKSLFEKIAND